MDTIQIRNISSAAYTMPGIKNVKLSLQKGGMDLFEKIIDTVCNFYNIDKRLIFKKNRQRQFVLCRQLIFYLGKQHTLLSLKAMGERFNKDHTTVIHSINTMNNLIDTEPQLVNDIEHIKNKL